MAKAPAILAVHLDDQTRGRVKAGTLTRDSDGAVIFTVEETYLRDLASDPVARLARPDV